MTTVSSIYWPAVVDVDIPLIATASVTVPATAFTTIPSPAVTSPRCRTHSTPCDCRGPVPRWHLDRSVTCAPDPPPPYRWPSPSLLYSPAAAVGSPGALPWSGSSRTNAARWCCRQCQLNANPSLLHGSRRRVLPRLFGPGDSTLVALTPPPFRMMNKETGSFCHNHNPFVHPLRIAPLSRGRLRCPSTFLASP